MIAGNEFKNRVHKFTAYAELYLVKTQSYTWLNLIKEQANKIARGRTLFELIYHNTPIYAVDRQPLFCTFCARAQNVSKQSCHLGPSGPNGKIRGKIQVFFCFKYIFSESRLKNGCCQKHSNFHNILAVYQFP